MQKELKTEGRRSGYIPSLDGWRAIAILGVLLQHDLPIRIGPFTDASWKGWGGFGVYLFFAISGVLICTRILEDEKKTGQVKLKAFYIRRLFRIQPAYLAYLGVVGLFMLVGVSHDHWHKWFGALFLFINFQHNFKAHDPGEAFLGHLWTLSVEEHFYILLSLFFFFTKKRRMLVFSALLMVLLPLQLLLQRHFYNASISPRRTYWEIQYLLVPAFAGLLLQSPRMQTLAQRWLPPFVAYTITLLVIFLQYDEQLPILHFRHFLQVSMAVLFCFTLWVVASMLHPESVTTRVLEWAPLRFLGRLSYSLYLWHIVFFVAVIPGARVSARWLLFLSQRPLKYIASFAAALASYFLIEKPLIRLGHRLAPPATPGHLDLQVAHPPVPQQRSPKVTC